MAKAQQPDSRTKSAISPTRREDYAGWYQSVVKEADLAEMAHVRGCMVIKPWGYGIWESIQRDLDKRIKATGHENAYFPLLIPLSYIEKEAQHVEGFAKEMAVVTHHRLEKHEGKLVPAGKLDQPLVVRPTSETIIGESFSRWVQSFRDLPLLINQWANVMRWEMRPRVFLRTSEFLWQEGHTAHATQKEAVQEQLTMLEVYRSFAEQVLALPVIQGEKTPKERFPGAESTLSIEAMMQDGKALQAGTSHYMGQNFAKSANIRFVNKDSEQVFAYTTSWGVSTRLIGAVVMAHADDDGLRLPPRVAPKQVAIVPILRPDGRNEEVMRYAESLAQSIGTQQFGLGQTIVAQLDRRDIRSVEKKWQWIKRGVPLIIEVGPRDMDAKSVSVIRRDQSLSQAVTMSTNAFLDNVGSLLDEIQVSLFEQAAAFMKQNTHREVQSLKDLTDLFSENPEAKDSGPRGGFVLGKWCGNNECEERIAQLSVTIRCIPTEQSGTEGRCMVCETSAKTDAVFAQAY